MSRTQVLTGATVIVVMDDGKRVTLSGRVAVIVRWLIAHADYLVLNDKVQVTFDCAGRTVSAETRRRELVNDPPVFS